MLPEKRQLNKVRRLIGNRASNCFSSMKPASPGGTVCCNSFRIFATYEMHKWQFADAKTVFCQANSAILVKMVERIQVSRQVLRSEFNNVDQTCRANSTKTGKSSYQRVFLRFFADSRALMDIWSFHQSMYALPIESHTPSVKNPPVLSPSLTA